MKALKWLDDNLELLICSILTVILACTMILQVFCRYVLNHALTWPEEAACYIHLWYAFIGISYASKNGLHLRVDTFVNLFPQKVRTVFAVLADVTLLVFFVYMVYVGVGVTANLIQTNQLSSALRLPMWIVYLSLAVGCAMAALRTIQVYVQKILRWAKKRKDDMR